MINLTTIILPIIVELKTNEQFQNHPKYYVNMLMNPFVITNQEQTINVGNLVVNT